MARNSLKYLFITAGTVITTSLSASSIPEALQHEVVLTTVHSSYSHTEFGIAPTYMPHIGLIFQQATATWGKNYPDECKAYIPHIFAFKTTNDTQYYLVASRSSAYLAMTGDYDINLFAATGSTVDHVGEWNAYDQGSPEKNILLLNVVNKMRRVIGTLEAKTIRSVSSQGEYSTSASRFQAIWHPTSDQ